MRLKPGGKYLQQVRPQHRALSLCLPTAIGIEDATARVSFGVGCPHTWLISFGEQGVKIQRLCARTCPTHHAPASKCFKAWQENSQREGQGRIRAGPLPRSSKPSHSSSSTGKSTGNAAALPHVGFPGQLKGKAGEQGQNHIRGTAGSSGEGAELTPLQAENSIPC